MLILLGTAVLFPVAIVGFALWECGRGSAPEEATVGKLARPVVGAMAIWFFVLLLSLEPISRSVSVGQSTGQGAQGAGLAAAATLVTVAFGFRAARAWCRHRSSQDHSATSH